MTAKLALLAWSITPEKPDLCAAPFVYATAAAGLRGIAVEAGGALVLGGKALGAEADRLGLFLVGVEP